MVVVDELTAEKTARDLLKATWAPELDAGECQLPVDPFYVATRLSIRVSVLRIGSDASPMFLKRPRLDAELYVNSEDTPNQRRFSCARELGFYLMRDPDRFADTWAHISLRGPDAPRSVDSAEGSATRFASELLMPEPILRTLTRTDSVPAIAVRFEVPPDVMNCRITQLWSR